MIQVKILSNSPDKKKFHEKMNKVLQKLEEKRVKLNILNALEVFGRNGDWHTVTYYKRVKTLEVWEIEKNYEK